MQCDKYSIIEIIQCELYGAFFLRQILPVKAVSVCMLYIWERFEDHTVSLKQTTTKPIKPENLIWHLCLSISPVKRFRWEVRWPVSVRVMSCWNILLREDMFLPGTTCQSPFKGQMCGDLWPEFWRGSGTWSPDFLLVLHIWSYWNVKLLVLFRDFFTSFSGSSNSSNRKQATAFPLSKPKFKTHGCERGTWIWNPLHLHKLQQRVYNKLRK